MPCRHKVGIHLDPATLQRLKFKIAIAVNARIWRTPLDIRRAKLVHDIAPKSALKIEGKVLNPQTQTHKSRILDIFERTTPRRRITRKRIVVKKLHRSAHNARPSLDQSRRRNRAIDPAAHRRNYRFATHLGCAIH
jgi:hypothetical protein